MDPSPQWSVVTRTSWWARLKGAFAGVLVGLLLFVASFPLLIWNEGRAVRRARALGEGAAAVVSVDAARPDPANEGALVHLVGPVAGAPLADPDFALTIEGIRLRRDVEVYQWRERSESEEREKVGGGTETVTNYSYERVWSSSPIDSERFHVQDGHQNPTAFPFPARGWDAESVHLGGFELRPAQIEQLDDWERVAVPAGQPLPALIAEGAVEADGGYYLGDPARPRVGDTRVTFAAVYPGEVSVVARQADGGLAPFTTSGGGTIELVDKGNHTAAAMFEAAISANRVLTWVLRVVGWVTMFVGIAMILRPLSVVADVVPVVGNVIEAGTGIIAALVAAVLALATIAAAWLFYRPLLALALLALAGGIFWLIRARLRARALPGSAAVT